MCETKSGFFYFHSLRVLFLFTSDIKPYYLSGFYNPHKNESIKKSPVLFLIDLSVARLSFRLPDKDFFSACNQKIHPLSHRQLAKSTEQNSRSPKTITLYSLSNSNNCCRAKVCSCRLLFPNLGNLPQI
jgi:hypothetical protein